MSLLLFLKVGEIYWGKKILKNGIFLLLKSIILWLDLQRKDSVCHRVQKLPSLP